MTNFKEFLYGGDSVFVPLPLTSLIRPFERRDPCVHKHSSGHRPFNCMTILKRFITVKEHSRTVIKLKGRSVTLNTLKRKGHGVRKDRDGNWTGQSQDGHGHGTKTPFPLYSSR